MGVKALEEGRIAEAVVFLEYATKFSPDNHQMWLLLGHAYHRNKQHSEAIDAYKRVADQAADPSIQGQARKALSSLEGGGVHGSVAMAEQTKVTCPDCRRVLVREPEKPLICRCGWSDRPVAAANPRLFVHDVQAYCRHHSVRVSIVFRGDLIVIGASEVRLQGLGTRTYPVNPRLLFASLDGMPAFEPEELALVMPKQDDAGVFRERRASDDMTLGKLYAWEVFVQTLSAFRGYDVSQQASSGSLLRVLTAHNALDLDLVQDALELQEGPETIGQTLLRLGISNFEAMLTAVLGEHRLARPASRPFHERLGSMLVARGVITPGQLQEALALQAAVPKLLGELLVTHVRACSAADIQAVLKAQRPFQPVLPEADMLGELLVLRKSLTRTDMLRALADEQSKQRVPLGEVLLNLDLVTEESLSSVLTWQNQKKQILQQGRHRLGEILLAQKVISSETLAEALKVQALDPRPLGQILVSKGFCTPEQVFQAMEQQVVRRNQAASRPMGAPTESLSSPEAGVMPAGVPRPSEGRAPAHSRASGASASRSQPSRSQASGARRAGKSSVSARGRGKGRKAKASGGKPWVLVGIFVVLLLVAGGFLIPRFLAPSQGVAGISTVP